MDADERLTALKKAYADIILNTAKEAASRIMVSERKAFRFQNELSVAKDEALRMLLRLKQMMDSKISEADNASLNQQRKIEELEAQLEEAEDIVRDLREELREVQAELEKVTNNRIRHLDEHHTATLEDASKENTLYTSQSIIFPPQSQDESIAACDMKNSNLNKRSDVHKCYGTMIHMQNSCNGKPDLPSIILRSKEPELYRNGCTQRIRACERHMLDRELSLSGQINDVKDKTNVREDEEGERISTAPTYVAHNTGNLEKKEVLQAESWLSSWYPIKSYCKKRKRATRYKRNKMPLGKFDEFRKIDQAPDISCSRIRSNSVENNANSLETDEKGKPGRVETTESEAEFVKACGVQNTINKDEPLIDKLVLARQETGSRESSGIPVCTVDLEKANVPLLSKASDTANGIPSQPPNDRIIKYTFQRKRKKEALTGSDGNLSLENNSLKRKIGEKQNGSLEPEKSSLITESSRDSRRLAQVARQLISLSERKWWQ